MKLTRNDQILNRCRLNLGLLYGVPRYELSWFVIWLSGGIYRWLISHDPKRWWVKDEPPQRDNVDC